MQVCAQKTARLHTVLSNTMGLTDAGGLVSQSITPQGAALKQPGSLACLAERQDAEMDS